MREHTIFGPYVEGLSQLAVVSAQEHKHLFMYSFKTILCIHSFIHVFIRNYSLHTFIYSCIHPKLFFAYINLFKTSNLFLHIFFSHKYILSFLHVEKISRSLILTNPFIYSNLALLCDSIMHDVLQSFIYSQTNYSC